MLAAGLVAIVSQTATGLPEDAEQSLSIHADEGAYDTDPNGVSTLSGNVQVEQGTLRVSASLVTITNKDGKLDRVVAEGRPGEPARFRQCVNRGEPLVIGHAQTIDYAIAVDRVQFEGNAFLSKGPRQFAGGVITWDMVENDVDCRSGCVFTLPPPTRSETAPTAESADSAPESADSECESD